jgi:hypothetical protein
MIDKNSLHHMYQAWCQGQDDPARDWSYFVEWAAKWNNTTSDKIIRVLQTTHWFTTPNN